MTVEYVAKAITDLRAVAELDPVPAFNVSNELPVPVRVIDAHEQTVLKAVITMWVTRKPA